MALVVDGVDGEVASGPLGLRDEEKPDLCVQSLQERPELRAQVGTQARCDGPAEGAVKPTEEEGPERYKDQHLGTGDGKSPKPREGPCSRSGWPAVTLEPLAKEALGSGGGRSRWGWVEPLGVETPWNLEARWEWVRSQGDVRNATGGAANSSDFFLSFYSFIYTISAGHVLEHQFDSFSNLSLM